MHRSRLAASDASCNLVAAQILQPDRCAARNQQHVMSVACLNASVQLFRDHCVSADVLPQTCMLPVLIALQSCCFVQVRMPSGMAGQKSTFHEGGIRTFLAVQGPGVPASATDSKPSFSAALRHCQVDNMFISPVRPLCRPLRLLQTRRVPVLSALKHLLDT
jgi:hypothetical protein